MGQSPILPQQHLHFMRLQRRPGGQEVFRLRPYLREQILDLAPGRVIQSVQRPLRRSETLGPGPVGTDDLMPVEQEVQIGDPAGHHLIHARQKRQMRRRNQHLTLAKQHFRPRPDEQPPVPG